MSCAFDTVGRVKMSTYSFVFQPLTSCSCRRVLPISSHNPLLYSTVASEFSECLSRTVQWQTRLCSLQFW